VLLVERQECPKNVGPKSKGFSSGEHFAANIWPRFSSWAKLEVRCSFILPNGAQAKGKAEAKAKAEAGSPQTVARSLWPPAPKASEWAAQRNTHCSHCAHCTLTAPLHCWPSEGLQISSKEFR